MPSPRVANANRIRIMRATQYADVVGDRLHRHYKRRIKEKKYPTFAEVARLLTDLKVPTPRGGTTWQAVQVQRVLRGYRDPDGAEERALGIARPGQMVRRLHVIIREKAAPEWVEIMNDEEHDLADEEIIPVMREWSERAAPGWYRLIVSWPSERPIIIEATG